MSNPWDRPPMPAQGDEDENATYAGVGRVVSRWELLEAEPADLYTIFVYARYHLPAYDAYYSEGKTSKARIATTEKAAERYFQRVPNQTLEGEFCGLMRKIKGFSDRRHEVAHGMVRNIDWYSLALPDYVPNDGPYRYCVVPPSYQREWYHNYLPKYVYTSSELLMLAENIFALAKELMSFKSCIPKFLS